MPLRVRIHSSDVSMIRESTSLGTTFFGIPIPVPEMTLFIFFAGAAGESCVRRSRQRKKVAGGELVLPATKLTHHFSSSLVDHLLKFLGREESQRRKRSFATARAVVSEWDIPSGIDLFVAGSVEELFDYILDRHFVDERAEWGRFPYQ